jgi:hypothetical protein
MKFRNQFLRFGGYQEEAPAPEQPTGGSGGAPATPPATPPAAPTLTAEQTAAISAILNGTPTPPATPPKPNAYDEHVNSQQEKKNQKEQQKAIEGAIKFNSEFTNTLSKYGKSFPEHTINLLSKTYDSETDKAEEIQKFAAKDFFLKAGNIELLPAAQQLEVKARLIAEHSDINMKGAEAWQMVETALHVLNQQQDKAKINGLYGESSEVPENIKAFTDRIYPKGTVELPTK